MKIIMLGPAHPYRGGLVSIIESMSREFIARGYDVSILTFTLQYPSLLFPGKSQTVETPPPSDLRITRCLNTINPLSWVKVGEMIKRERPDMVILKYWTPFMAPSFGTVARIARSNGVTKVICQIDNVQPHENRLVDRPLNSYFLGSIDGFIYMSDQVGEELKAYTTAPALFSPHPMFENLGSRVDRDEACQSLELDPSQRYALFFGLIRDYKGLDMLIEAWSQSENSGRKLIIAGEFYTNKQPYLDLIERCGGGDSIILHDHFVTDADVKLYFSVADFVALPYRSATQSGVTQIAYNFSTPMLVTRVGGLPQLVPHNVVGLNCDPTVESVAEALVLMWDEQNLQRFQEGIFHERKRFSWQAMCDSIETLHGVCSAD